MNRIAAITAVLALSAFAAHAEDWGDNTDYASDSAYSETMAMCRQVKGRQPPASDRPDAAAARSLKGCSSEALYYGIGIAADPVKARQCAFVEAANPEEGGVFSGETMLMTIYANGRGAKRDLDLAIHYACRIDGAPMEYDGRIRHLAALKTKPEAEPFHFCNDVTSGLAGGYCASHEADIAGAKRDARLAKLMAAWTPAERAAFAPLKAAMAAYVDAHGGKEVDMSGTLRAALQTSAEEEVRADFADMLEALQAGRVPPGDYKAADAALNAAFKKARAFAPGDMGTVTREDILDAQRTWLKYRDAFIAFAKVKWPGVSSDSVAAWMTQTRTKMLEGSQG